MQIDALFVDKWITLELASVLSAEPSPVEPLFPDNRKAAGMYALYFPEHESVYFGEAGDLEHAKADHLYKLRCQRHENPAVQQAYLDDPEGKVLFFTILTTSRERSRSLLEQFLTAYDGQVQLLNNGVVE
jgi:hypothetical protein